VKKAEESSIWKYQIDINQILHKQMVLFCQEFQCCFPFDCHNFKNHSGLGVWHVTAKTWFVFTVMQSSLITEFFMKLHIGRKGKQNTFPHDFSAKLLEIVEGCNDIFLQIVAAVSPLDVGKRNNQLGGELFRKVSKCTT